MTNLSGGFWRQRLVSVFLASLILAGGCTRPKPDVRPVPDSGRSIKPAGDVQKAKNYAVKRETVYYKHGPQQASPPDGTLKPGTKVKLLRDEGSYWRVWVPDQNLDVSVDSGSLEPA